MSNELKNRKISECFALARSLGYEGEEAHEFLHQAANTDSLLILSQTRLIQLATQLRNQVQSQDRPNLVTEPQWRAVWALRRRLKCNEDQFKGMVKHITGLDHSKFLDVPRCRALIAGMNKIADGKGQASRQSTRQWKRRKA